MRNFPAEWRIARLDEVAYVQMGRQRSPKNARGEHMRRYLRAANVRWRGLNLDEVLEMNFPPGEFEKYRLEPGDILVVEGSGSADQVGRPVVWRGEIPDCCFQNHLIRVRPSDHLSEFLNYYFMSEALAGRFGEAAGGIGINHLGAGRLSAWEVPVPSFDEQRGIVEAIETHLSHLDAAVELIERARRNVERMRAAVLQAAITGKLVAQNPAEESVDWTLKHLTTAPPSRKSMQLQPILDDDEPFLLPDGWAFQRLGNLAELINGDRGVNYPSKADRSAQGVPFVNAGDLKGGRIDYTAADFIAEDHFQRLRGGKFRPGDIIYCIRGSLGKAAVVGDNERGAIASSLVLVRTVGQIMPEFMYFYLVGGIGAKMVRRYDNGTAQPNLAAASVRQFVVPVPPMDEQRRIVVAVERWFEHLDASWKQTEVALRRSGGLRRSILSAAFQGSLTATVNVR